MRLPKQARSVVRNQAPASRERAQAVHAIVASAMTEMYWSDCDAECGDGSSGGQLYCEMSQRCSCNCSPALHPNAYGCRCIPG